MSKSILLKRSRSTEWHRSRTGVSHDDRGWPRLIHKLNRAPGRLIYYQMNKMLSSSGLRSRRPRSTSLISKLCRYQAGNQAASSAAERFAEVSREWWETLASRQDWVTAAELGQVTTTICPREAFGWENWAWALHKQGKTPEAYKVLAPILRKLKLPGPPSGRAAYCLACFCAALGKLDEANRWLYLAYLRAVDRNAFRQHALCEPDLQGCLLTFDSQPGSAGL